jgi:Asp-tRNA(Asn)/Glu-tRNA(Gln) amidotransferase A subunit family amidase
VSTKLHQLSLRTAVSRLRNGELSAVDYARALLGRCARREPVVRAFAWLDSDAVLEKARAADRHRADGKACGVLHGIPVGVKDIVDTAGIPTRMGSPLFEHNVPGESATVVQRFEREGAYTMGKTVTAELAYFYPGPTTNPWNPAHTPGGSSMGSAAAVAAGMVPVALGTQTNGSVIRPAAFCGCVGYKPSQGLVSRAGIFPFAQTLDQVGVFARSIDDAGLFASVLIGHDPKDPLSRPGMSVDELRDIRPLYQPPRLAAVRSPVWRLAEPAAQAHFDDTVARLRTAGAMVDDVDVGADFAAAHEAQRTLMYFGGAHTFAELQSCHRARLSEPLNRLIDEGRTIDESRLREARERRTRLIGEFARLAGRYDAIVTPPARGEAPATLDQTGDPVFCTIWTLLGVPALTFPSGRGPGGLPFGLQCVGGFLEDARLLSVAQWCARELGSLERFPA